MAVPTHTEIILDFAICSPILFNADSNTLKNTLYSSRHCCLKDFTLLFRRLLLDFTRILLIMKTEHRFN